MDDIVRTYGYLCLGSRLKRIGERLQGDVVRLGDRLGVAVQPGQFPLLAALDRHGPMTIGELVEAVGASQPGVTRNVARLVEAGWVRVERRHADQRRRTVSLTTAGAQGVARARLEIWPLVEAAVAQVCGSLSGGLLEQLSGLEDALTARPMDVRALGGGT